MLSDARIAAALASMLQGIDAPPVPVAQIQRRIAEPQTVVRAQRRYFDLVSATAGIVVLVLLALPSRAPGFIDDIEARYRSALQALGGIAPPPAPKSLVSSLSSRNASLAAAQSRVQFTIVPPTGLPKDVVSAKIRTTSTGVYSKATHSWRLGPQAVSFVYRRANGLSFILAADRFDPQEGPPPKYMFEARDPAPDGRPVIVKHEHFAWRNGNQIMSVSEGDSLSAEEIKAIQAAMHGVPMRRRELFAPDSGTSHKLYLIPGQ